MDEVMLAGILSYGFYAFFVMFAICALWKGDDFLMKDKTYTEDPETGKWIRATDNVPKEGDDFRLTDQYDRPMTEREIKDKIDRMSFPDGSEER